MLKPSSVDLIVNSKNKMVFVKLQKTSFTSVDNLHIKMTFRTLVTLFIFE